MLQPDTGVVAWFLQPFGLSGPGYGFLGIVITLSYLWLPYMILPIYAGLTRLPDSMLDASADLGAGNGRTFRSVVMPLLFPSIVAGSIFTSQLGFAPGDPQIAVLAVPAATPIQPTFNVVNHTTNAIIYTAA